MEQTFYIYRYVNGNHNNIAFLGTFTTKLPLVAVWDMIFQVFCDDGSNGGMFVRKEMIN